MEKIDTPIEGLFILRPRIFNDNRGSFYESYNKKTLESLGLNCEFVQDNQSESSYGTLRGLHMQVGDAAQAKLVRVLQGRVYDVAVDLGLTLQPMASTTVLSLVKKTKFNFLFREALLTVSLFLVKGQAFFTKLITIIVKIKSKELFGTTPISL